MARIKYKVEIKSDSPQSDFPRAELELAGFSLTSSDRKKWTGEHEIEVTGKLNYRLRLWAVSGTDWSMSIKNMDTQKEVFSDTGTTGESFPNFSQRSGEVDPA